MRDKPALTHSSSRKSGRRCRPVRRSRWTTGVGVTVVLALNLLPAIARADDQDVIDYRQHVMNTLEDQMVLINQIVHKQAPADNLATFAQILAMTAATAESAFKPNVAGGDSKPAVWSSWPDFSKQLAALVASTADLATTAKSGDVSAVAAKIPALDCMGCHNTYMQKK